MQNLVVILGAGASAGFGVPTLLRVFQDDHARRHLRSDKFLTQTLQQVFWGPRGRDLETSHLSLTVEEILTIIRDFDYQAYETPDLPIEDPKRFKRSLYVMIKKAVYDGKNSTARHLNPLLTLARQRFQQVTWASFNWDCIFEASYYYSSASPIYSHMRTNPKVAVPLKNYWGWSPSSHLFLKLHGGVNWWYENGELMYLPFGPHSVLDDRWDQYERRDASGQPIILEPSFYKYEDPVYELLKVQWHQLVASLLKADLVIVIGYSLPEADTEARRALTIGFQSNPHAEFIVIDSAGWACDRYIRLFGQSRLRCIQAPFEDVAENIAAIIPTAERILGPGHLHRDKDKGGDWFWKDWKDKSEICLGSTLNEALGQFDECVSDCQADW